MERVSHVVPCSKYKVKNSSIPDLTQNIKPAMCLSLTIVCPHAPSPIPTGSSTSDPSLLQVAVTFDQVDKGGLELRYPYGFELGCSPSKGEQHNVIAPSAHAHYGVK